MTVAEILEQAKALSQTERKQLLDLLHQLDAEIETTLIQPQQEHWGKNLIRLLDEVGSIELMYPEIEDPVEWVKQIRLDQAKKRGLDWGEEE